MSWKFKTSFETPFSIAPNTVFLSLDLWYGMRRYEVILRPTADHLSKEQDGGREHAEHASPPAWPSFDWVGLAEAELAKDRTAWPGSVYTRTNLWKIFL